MALEKQVAIARSGVYDYAPQELGAMPGLDAIPTEYQHRTFFSVYRPAAVLAAAKDKFVKLPLTNEHPNGGKVDGRNYRDVALGWTGDSASVEYIPDAEEVIIRSDVNLVDNEAIRAYHAGIRDVSPGYRAHFRWQQGKTKSGIEYQIVMDAITEVNHLAMTQRGRGGNLAVILDSKGAMMPKWKSGLKWMLSKIGITTDSDMGAFRTMLEGLMAGVMQSDPQKKLSDEQINQSVDKLKELMSDLPESDEKSKLSRYLEDLPALLQQGMDQDKAEKMVDVIANLFESLDSDAMEDVGMKITKDSEAPGLDKGAVNEVKEKKPDTEDAGGIADPPKEAPVTPQTPQKPEAKEPAGEMSLDTLPEDTNEWSPQHIAYALKELITDLKSRKSGSETQEMGDDGEAAPNEGGETHVHMHLGDSAPIFGVSMASRAAGESLDSFFSDMYAKKGKK